MRLGGRLAPLPGPDHPERERDAGRREDVVAAIRRDRVLGQQSLVQVDGESVDGGRGSLRLGRLRRRTDDVRGRDRQPGDRRVGDGESRGPVVVGGGDPAAPHDPAEVEPDGLDVVARCSPRPQRDPAPSDLQGFVSGRRRRLPYLMLSSLTAGSERTRRLPETVSRIEPRNGPLNGAGKIAAEGGGALVGVAAGAAGVDGCAEALGDGVGLGAPQPASIVMMTRTAGCAACPLCRIPTPRCPNQPRSGMITRQE